ncbi:hypothetical protein DLAC_02806 [Tieghemostelium lacteum]|uniref:Uncharacterized protein n=1 Tax=Tieghemostelium lacteum TaxID=361077 RepID=A0A152A3C6_TIELA|nr:hypothetical protein DLAC_02806 [Tieghemostelium lacteum]|eukprot:KYR00763.1 hypothetical protein DLAC_02806 [Tieghemostelium lacteum]
MHLSREKPFDRFIINYPSDLVELPYDIERDRFNRCFSNDVEIIWEKNEEEMEIYQDNINRYEKLMKIVNLNYRFKNFKLICSILNENEQLQYKISNPTYDSFSVSTNRQSPINILKLGEFHHLGKAIQRDKSGKLKKFFRDLVYTMVCD